MAASAIFSLFGSKIININLGFLECYWKFNEILALFCRNQGPPT
ncbi:Cytochrome P450 [Stemphylium lycopersici]|uniref:Cytochrome P450 n=1 Tax=Stemphylium lycopersici TaxID=183478 RepID=A0A364MRS1_STELY|nr:Cytochrome P450 [Stemphylium lycopersici]